MKLINSCFYSNMKMCKIWEIQYSIAIELCAYYHGVWILEFWNNMINWFVLWSSTLQHTFINCMKKGSNFIMVYCIWYGCFHFYSISQKNEIFMAFKRYVITFLKNKCKKFHLCIIEEWEHIERRILKFKKAVIGPTCQG